MGGPACLPASSVLTTGNWDFIGLPRERPDRNVGPVTVREKIDQLATEPGVGDLGYPADQRDVAGPYSACKFLADEIDAMRADVAGGPAHPQVGDADLVDESVTLADVADQLADLTAQVEKLTRAVKRNTVERNTVERSTKDKRTKKKGKKKKRK